MREDSVSELCDREHSKVCADSRVVMVEWLLSGRVGDTLPSVSAVNS